MMPTKTCCRCKISKFIEDFPKSTRGLYKVHSICKSCKKLYMQEYRKSGKLKRSKDKYCKTIKGQKTIKAYTSSLRNKKIQSTYRKSILGTKSGAAKLAKYRARKKNAAPAWVDDRAIKNIYANCPATYEVDHIIPLHNDIVSGLHVPWNLQYLTRSQNASKANSFDGTYSNESWKRIY